MPNHVHGIIQIDNVLRPNNVLSEDLFKAYQPQSLSTIVGALKSYSSKSINLLKFMNNQRFEWQRSYHDHIIRDKESFDKISNYIINNPKRWYEDSLR